MYAAVGAAFANPPTPPTIDQNKQLYDAYAAGAIPIYFGAPNVAEFAFRNSYIDAADFASPSELARYLSRVASDADLYNVRSRVCVVLCWSLFGHTCGRCCVGAFSVCCRGVLWVYRKRSLNLPPQLVVLLQQLGA